MIMGIDEVGYEAGSWIEKHLPEMINGRGQVNLFETTIRVLGGLLSAYHLSGANMVIMLQQKDLSQGSILKMLGTWLIICWLLSNPSTIPFSDVLRDRSSHPAPDGLSSAAEVSTLQLEFSHLSSLTGDLNYTLGSMKVLEHMKTLPKFKELVPIYIEQQPSPSVAIHFFVPPLFSSFSPSSWTSV